MTSLTIKSLIKSIPQSSIVLEDVDEDIDYKIVYQDDIKHPKLSIFDAFLRKFHNKYFLSNDKMPIINNFINILKGLTINIDVTFDISSCTCTELLYVLIELFDINIIVYEGDIHYVYTEYKEYKEYKEYSIYMEKCTIYLAKLNNVYYLINKDLKDDFIDL